MSAPLIKALSGTAAAAQALHILTGIFRLSSGKVRLAFTAVFAVSPPNAPFVDTNPRQETHSFLVARQLPQIETFFFAFT